MIVGDVPIRSREATQDPPGWWLIAPGWAEARVAAAEPVRERLALQSGPVLTLSRRDERGWSLLSASVDLPDDAPIDGVTAEIYNALTSRFSGGAPASPVRFWNLIPAIHSSAGRGLDRYRAFNIGRHRALMQWSGSEEAFARLLPTATGVGHDGRELVVHCLAGRVEAVSVENPRQQPAYRYSQRFGPVAPSFARATIAPGMDGAAELIVGGTSSVRGEDSMHPGDPAAQLEETLANLRALITHASGGGVAGEPLTRLESVRVYYSRPSDLARLVGRLDESLGQGAQVEYLRADICREELLVEIEGVARLDKPGAVR